jgi:hypothetical protein
MGTAGSGSGPRKRTGRKTGTAPRADFASTGCICGRMKMSTPVVGWRLGCSRRSCLILRSDAVVNVERRVGRTTFDHGEDRGNVGLVAGAADREAKSRTWDWKSCRAA